MSTTQKQYLRAKNEVESSLSNARTLRDQWLVATKENPTNLTKKEIDYIGKAFKNRLLTVKWDCEDLEELINVCEIEDRKLDAGELEKAKIFIEDCRNEISKFMDQLEETESNNKIFNKHGISIPTSGQTTTSIVQNPGNRYERLSNNDAEEVQFDKGQVASSASIFNNVLYDHLEQSEQQKQPISPTQVFNNLSRPVTNVYMNPNENEIILDMLETEYYNPPSALKPRSRFTYAVRKLLETDRNKFLGTIAFIFSFPILLVLFLLV